MLARRMVSHVLADEALTRGLGDAEARVLVEWLVERAEVIAESESSSAAWDELHRLRRRSRAIGRFVALWCHECARGAAGQLAAAERFAWPLPAAQIDPCELMQAILSWETTQLQQAAAAPTRRQAA